MKTAEEYLIKQNPTFKTVSVKSLHSISGKFLLTMMESYAEQAKKEHAIDWPDDKETERIRQLGKEKYYVGSSQSAYSEGFMDCVNWIKRVTTKQ